MAPEQEERLVAAFESIAKSLERACLKAWPEPPERSAQQLEPTLTRVPNDEDRAREHFVEPEDFTEEEIGPRERAFLESQKRDS